MLNMENAKRYLKDFMPKEDILKPVIKEKKTKQTNKIVEFEEKDDGYNVKDIIRDCPKINIIREFFKYQVSQIKDEDNNLFV